MTKSTTKNVLSKLCPHGIQADEITIERENVQHHVGIRETDTAITENVSIADDMCPTQDR